MSGLSRSASLARSLFFDFGPRAVANCLSGDLLGGGSAPRWRGCTFGLIAALCVSVGCKQRDSAADDTERKRSLAQSASARGSAPSTGVGSTGVGSTGATAASAEPAALPALPAGLEYVDGPGVVERVKATKAKGVVVNVWASWCGPCKAEVPMLLKLQKELGPDAIEFVFVSVDSPDKAAPALSFLQEQGINDAGLIAQPPLDAFKAALTPRWRGSLPASFLFDPSGKLRYWWGAQVFEHEITPILQGFLAGEHIDGEANFQIRSGGGAPQ